MNMDPLPDDYVDLIDSPGIVDGKIVRVSSSGNGIVDTGHKELNIGPVSKDAVGETVEIREARSNLAECLEESIKNQNYEIEWVLKKLIEGTPPPGAEFLVEISHINNSGNGMADLGDRTINLGSIREEAVGRTVPVKMIDNSFAKCLEIDARTSPYKFPGAVNEQYIPEPNCEFSDIIDLISDDGNGIIIAGRRSVNIGPIQLDSLGERVRVEMIDHQFGICLTPEIRARDYQSWLKEREADSAAYEKQKKDIIHQTEPSGLNARDKQISGESGSKSTKPDTNNSEPSSADSKPGMPGKSKLKELREKAEDAATDNPTRDTSATIGSRYIRAPAIKEYAKTRAEGYCEYCGELAPFETNDGEPYLEVHHVDELGEGGVDHPDKVVALCPVCHKEIHHGKRGEKMNSKLRKKLNNGLADAGVSENQG